MERGKIHVLILGQDAALEVALGALGVDVVRAQDVRSAGMQLEANLFDLSLVPVAANASLPWVSALHEACSETPVVALGPDRDELMRGALAAGATEYLVWPSAPEALKHLMDALVLRGRASVPSASPQSADSGLIGKSPQLAAARDLLSRVASGASTVLVRGETGTGKELAARAIHAQSPRRAAPFVKVHTPAVPDALLESELFGYEKGAFTGANARKPGRVELAEGGTLFLDEIGEISPTMQAKLLRLIQDREFERLGGTRTLRADIRVVAATHRDLERLVETGQFREDLFYRLNVVTIWLPPLRARRDDIALIVEHYLERFCIANHKRLILDEAARHELEAERWPGNVRQLVNFIERLVVLAKSDRITAADVRDQLRERLDFLTQAVPADGAEDGARADDAFDTPVPNEPPSEVAAPAALAASSQEFHFSSAVRPLKEDIRRTELRAITKALHFAKGNRALAARLLGVSRRTLYTKLGELGID